MIQNTSAGEIMLPEKTSKTIFDKSVPGRHGVFAPPLDVKPKDWGKMVPQQLLRSELPLPEVSELEVVRHYMHLSHKNFAIDLGFYPLGSCTMKYNPKINEDLARHPGFAFAHPLQPEELSQGALELMWNLQNYLCEITGMDAFTLQPAAGAHGELTGIMLMKKHFETLREKRTKILIPDSAHGTNPATASMCGFETVEVKSSSTGGVDLSDLKSKMSKDVAGIMLTNPNTLGIFDENIVQVCKIVHQKGGLTYCDGANMNAIVGISKPADSGFDIIHLNLHKTFSTPHGGGGPGSGPVGVIKKLVPYLPKPLVRKKRDKFFLDYNLPKSIGKVRAFYGNFGMHVRAYTYIRYHGPEGLRKNSENAVLNANYLRVKLMPHFKIAYDRICQHECVFSDDGIPNGVRTLDIAKRLLDFGFHAPTIYFPLIVHGAIMIEPTETESKETLDEFVAALIKIKQEALENPELVKSAPHTMPVKRLDEVRAARQPVIRWKPESSPNYSLESCTTC